MTSGNAPSGWGGYQAPPSPPIYVPPPPIYVPPPPAYLPLPPPPADRPARATATFPVPRSGFGPPPRPWTPPPLPPPARHSPIRWFVAGVCLLLIVTFAGIGAFVGVSDLAGLNRSVAAWRDAWVLASPPAANAPATEWGDWARRGVDAAVREQAQALAAKDQNRFLATADPENKDLVAALGQRFDVLLQMGVGQWTQALRAPPKATGERTWDAEIKISYCFGDASCRPVPLIVGSGWEFKNDQLLMVKLDPSGPDQMGPRPWEFDDLTVATGNRVIVAASKNSATRVPGAVMAADRAAKVADSLARWSSPPSRYVIFLAGPSDWQRWYGHEQPGWAAAWAVPVSGSVTEVLVHTQAVQQRGLEQLLTHELTHVTTLAGTRLGANRNAWWLIEGVADYATMIGKSVGEYDALTPTRDFVRARWDGNPAVEPPNTDASLEEASARYGVAFLAVRRISEVYGQDKMLDFWGRIVHDNATAEAAASQVLGVDWPTVKADCAQYIRGTVG